MHGQFFFEENGQYSFPIRPALQLCSARALASSRVLELFGSRLESPWTRLGRRLWTEAKLPRRMCTILKEDCTPLCYVFSALIHLCLCCCRTGSLALRGLPHERLTLLTWWVGGPGRAPQTWCGYY